MSLMCDTSQIYEWRHTILRFSCRIKDFGLEPLDLRAILAAVISTIRSDECQQ